jgi:hypothetical protein
MICFLELLAEFRGAAEADNLGCAHATLFLKPAQTISLLGRFESLP